ncbi:ParB/RepB/Spo0J family partition protein [Streptomyces kaempferi]
MHTIVGNPDNPRPEDDYNDSDPEFRELKASMKEIGQLQPVAVVSRSVFEQAKPDAVAAAKPAVRKLLTDADWVVVTGNRRLAAARQLGWTRIDIRVQDQLGDEEGRIDEAVIIENIHRKNLAPIKEAEYLAGMLKRHGSQEKVAERIGKSQVYVSQRLALLKLAPDLQEAVDGGTLKIKQARMLAGKTSDHDQQRAQAAELKAIAAEPAPPGPRSTPPVQNPVLKPAPESERSSGPAEFHGVTSQEGASRSTPGTTVEAQPSVERPEQAAPPAAEVVPEPRVAVEPGDGQQPKRLPYDDGPYIGHHLAVKMGDPAYFAMLQVLVEKGRERNPEELAAVLEKAHVSAR